MLLGKFIGQFKTAIWIILILLALALLVPTTIPSFHHLAQPDLGTISGKKVTLEDFTNAQQAVEIGLRLNNNGELPRHSRLNDQIAQMAWTRLLLISEARALGIQIPDADSHNHLTSMPAFQKDGRYDPQLYKNFVSNFLGSLGISESKFLQSVKDDLLIEAFRQALTAGLKLTPQEINEEFERTHGLVHLEIIEIKDSDHARSINPSQEEVQKEYNENPNNPDYRTPAQRKIHAVKWSLTPEQKKLPDSEKASLLRALRNEASDFALALITPRPNSDTPPTIQELAKEKQLTLITTSFFTEEQSPKEIPSNFSLVRTAFRLSQESPTSDVIQVNDDFLVIALAEEKPSTLRPLNEVKDKVVSQIKQRLARQKAREQAQEIYNKLNSALTEGKSWPEALKSLNLKAEPIKPFAPIQEAEILKHPIGQSLLSLAYRLKTNQLSSPVSTPNGQLIAYLKKREPADPSKLEDFKKQFTDTILSQKQQQLLQEWIQNKLTTKGYSLPAFLRQAPPNPLSPSPTPGENLTPPPPTPAS
ncbi:MAG: SurA N-terminal domain-containing protein [Methylacidiphilales bacterium]|nr:SurA N-terminal domain-containing protein [Candidatus Methylacidiphilales bacterium]MDW8349668.1 SurA N-terminal domain-containing protein [Verrucomicrobiae bacterium]